MTEAPVLNANQAIAKHVNWKIVLQFAITVEEQLTPDQIFAIQHHRQCPIGRWLDSPGNASLRLHPAYRDLVQRHLEFHKEMIAVSELIAQNRFYEAAASIKIRSAFAEASLALARSITILDQVTSIAAPL